MLGMGPTEIIVILVFALLIFGPKRLPEIAQAVGKGIGELKRASKGLQDAVQKDIIQPLNEDLIDPLKSANPAEVIKPTEASESEASKDDVKGDSKDS